MQTEKTKLYIKFLEKKEKGKINWERWEELVEQTKREIDDALRNR